MTDDGKSNIDSFADISHWRIELGGSFLLLIVADVITLPPQAFFSTINAVLINQLCHMSSWMADHHMQVSKTVPQATFSRALVYHQFVASQLPIVPGTIWHHHILNFQWYQQV